MIATRTDTHGYRLCVEGTFTEWLNRPTAFTLFSDVRGRGFAVRIFAGDVDITTEV